MTSEWLQTIFFILILTGLEVAAEVLLKPYKSNAYTFLVLFGIAAYIILACVLAYILRRLPNKLGVINTIWQSLNIIVVFAVTVFVFKEQFHFLQVVGVAVAMLAAILMVIPEL